MTGDLQANWRAVAELVEKLMKRTGTPGVAVGILAHGEQFTGGFGVTNVDHPLPVTDTTLFQIGSITKTHTGTAVMRLVEQGKIRLDAKVRQYLPDFKVADPDASANATVQQLLTHMGGWDGDLFIDTGDGDDALAKGVAALADREQMAPLGAVWSYNNAGFSVAGRIMEVVVGKPFEAQIKELVFAPLGMQHSFIGPKDVMIHRFASGHAATPDGPKVQAPWAIPRFAHPAGGIVTTVVDMLKYARFHLGDGRGADGSRVLTTESLALMHSPQVSMAGKVGWGITFQIDDSFGPRQYGHGGGVVGQISQLTIVPEHEFAIIVVTNAYEGAVITKEVPRFALKHFLGIEVKDPDAIPATEKDYLPYTGRYARPNGYVDLGLIGGRLIAQMVPTAGFPSKESPVPPPPPPMQVELAGPDLLRVQMGPSVELGQAVRRPDGSIGWLRFGGRIFKRV